MAQRYAWEVTPRDAPGMDIVPVTPNNDADQINYYGTNDQDSVIGYRALRTSAAGMVRVTMSSGKVRDLEFQAGEMKPGQFLRVWSSGTSVLDSAGDRGIEGYI